MFQNSPLPAAQEVRDSSCGVTPCIVMKNDRVLYHQVHSFLMSPCNYDLFAKVKEPLLRTRYITRDEFIHAIVRSIRNSNKDGRADGVRRLPNICHTVIKGAIILKVHNFFTPVNKAMSEISNCCHYFYPTFVK